MRVVVIGGGAAGFFAAISVKEHHPQAHVQLLEKSDKVLSKVRISGGGRCNATHRVTSVGHLVSCYPRGGRFLRKAFALFGQADTVKWFEGHGVELKAEPDGRMFPVSDDSGTIINCLTSTANELGVELRTGRAVAACRYQSGTAFELSLQDGSSVTADRVIVSTGGHPKATGYDLLSAMGHTIVPPVPSLFTFNMPDEPIRELMGVVVDPVRVRIIGTDLEGQGPLLITHWGMSGPAILRLSAWGARLLNAMRYEFVAQVNWLGGRGEVQVRSDLASLAVEIGRKQTFNANPFLLPKRHWAHLLHKADIDGSRPFAELAKRDHNKLIDLLTNDRYTVRGKTTFKEEFVTAGGVVLDEVDPTTMESRLVPGLFLAGEVLDIDGITGGFNFQAAWTTGRIAGMLGDRSLA